MPNITQIILIVVIIFKFRDFKLTSNEVLNANIWKCYFWRSQG